MIFRNYFFMARRMCVQPPLLARLAAVSVLEAGGKPSTWFPPGRLVEPTSPPAFPRDHIRILGSFEKSKI